MKKIVAVLFSLLFLLPTHVYGAGSATLSLSPISGSKQVNNVFTVEVHVNTAGVAVNTIKSYLTFDPAVLTVNTISTTGSVATFFTETDSDNVNGTIHITGAASGTGYTGANGLVATINFQAKGSGTSTLTFTSDSKIFSNADNSDILNFAGLTNGSYVVSGTAAATPTPVSTGSSLVSSSSALPQSGSFSDTLMLFSIGLLLLLAGVSIANPHLLAPAQWKKQAEKNILKKL